MPEIVMNELLFRLWFLVIECRRVKTPQKWVGSCLAVGYDADYHPKRYVMGSTLSETKYS
jgi:hypothetical protein